MTAPREPRDELREAVRLLELLVDGAPCEFRGFYCMAHHEKARPGQCPQELARSWLARLTHPE